MITVVGVPNLPGHAASIFRSMADQGICVDLVLQRAAIADGKADITFTCGRAGGAAAMRQLESLKDRVGYDMVTRNDAVCKVALEGAGIRSHPAVTATFCEALAIAGVNLALISTSEIRIAVIVQDDELEATLNAIEDAFGVVYNSDYSAPASRTEIPKKIPGSSTEFVWREGLPGGAVAARGR